MNKYLLCSAMAIAGTLGVATNASASGAANWAGAYAGINAGWGFGADTEIVRPSGPPGPPGINTTNDLDGFIGGAQIGYNFANSGGLVFGIVGDIALADFSDTNADGPPGPPSVWKTDYEWIATLRARFGMLVDPSALVYVHGGIALADIETKEIGGAGPWAGKQSKETEVGYVIGVGAEKQFTDRISAFAEYSYMDFGDSAVTPPGPPGTLSFDNDGLHTIKIGINIKFSLR